MFRYRRYRVFLVFAAVAIIALYKFGSLGPSWTDAASSAANAAGLRKDREEIPHVITDARPVVVHETKSLWFDVPAASRPAALHTPPPVKRPSWSPTPSPVASKDDDLPAIPTPIRPQPRPHPVGPANPGIGLIPSISIEVEHWTKLPEQFPVPSESLIRLPSGKPRAIPKIQTTFKPEAVDAKAITQRRLAIIKGVFQKSWSGYREHAWDHDELKPVSGTFRDPFAGWRATLVDALDTLWIMDMKDEFEDAIKAVETIDFTTTSRADIPLFETTIRYLGGLIAAYDISGMKYRSLLDKAVELAEVLISAFDTPNRMPETYYYWRPQFASQKHRASQRVVLAEIGSLSLEFTRLAQLTGDDKFYDAVARITDNLEQFQNHTMLPGMWPTNLDASGCGRVHLGVTPDEPLKAPVGFPRVHYSEGVDLLSTNPTASLSPQGNAFIPLNLPSPVLIADAPLPERETSKSSEILSSTDTVVSTVAVESNENLPLNLPDPVVFVPNGKKLSGGIPALKPQAGEVLDWSGRALDKRQLDVDMNAAPKQELSDDVTAPGQAVGAQPATPTPPECIEQGFVSTSGYGHETYTLGGESDSTYEYLPKEWLLLGGQVEKYQTMYERSTNVVKEHLIFRPMLPKNDDVLFCGKLNVPSSNDPTKVGDLTGEYAHLTCFAGGMFGMGAKLFNRPEDLEIAKKLTEGCVYSYSMTPSGIMPESFEALPCESREHCDWNETAYWEILDPRSEVRLQNYQDQRKIYESQYASASSWYEAQLAAMKTHPPTPVKPAAFEVDPTHTPVYADTLDRRQLPDLMDAAEIAHMPSGHPIHQDRDSVMGGEPEEGEGPPTNVQPDLAMEEFQPSLTLPAFPYVYSPHPAMTHKDYVQNRIQEERLPLGVTRIGARNYILRPEAIESVWYMYRITGDKHWREAGWKMFEAVNQHTSTKYGNSAIDDVTKQNPQLNDEMESFWLAETMKYFYLLFSDEDVVSLDDWVLNTEAHPFRRPK
ncbi:hypothetical protein ACN47E_004126 [Coniothyrium glycines]